MAAGDFVIGAKNKVREGDVAQLRVDSEAVMTKLAGSVNFIIDRSFYKESLTYSGYFHPNGDAEEGIRYVKNQAQIIDYTLSLGFTGSGGSSSANYGLYNNAGAFIGNLFSTPPSMSGGSKSTVLLNRDEVAASTTLINTAGVTVVDGILNFPIIPAQTMMLPFIVSAGARARDMFLDLRLQEI